MGKRGDIVAVLVIVLVALVRFTPFFIGGNLVNSDSWKNYYPWQESYKSSEIKTLDVDADVEYHVWLPFARKEIAQGRFPNWNPYSFSGSPLYANHLVPVFHIPLAIALLFPSEKVPTAYALVMLIMGPLFFYFFLRNWRLGCFVSLFGAIAFMFSGRMDLSFPPDVASFIWVPAILLFYDRFVERGNIYDAFLGAFCLGQLLIAGYPVYVIHFAYFATVYVLWRRFHPSFAKMISTRRWLTGLLVILVGSVLISAVQNYPTYEYMKLTKRGLASEKAVFEYQMSSSQKAGGEVQEKDSVADGKSFILEKLSTKVPYIIPAFMQYKGRVYVGAVVIFLVLIGLVCSDRKFLPMKIYILVLMVLVLIPPVFRIFAVWVPGWSISARNPVPIFFFTLLFLGSLGLDIVLKKEPRSKTWFFVGAIYLAILFCLARLHPAYYLEPYKQVYRWNVQDDVLFLVAYISISALIIAYLVLRFYMKKVSREWDYLVIAIFICISFWTHIYSYQNFISPHPMQSGKEIQRIKELSDGGQFHHTLSTNKWCNRGSK